MKESACLSLVLLLMLGGSLSGVAATADAQSLCTSDGQPSPTVLRERFINADCEACWREPAGSQTDASPSTVSLDWIAPGPEQEQGALSAAARIDALSRLKALGRALPLRSDQRTQAVASDPAAHSAQLRVAHGVPVGDYLGTSIEWRNAPPGRWRAWLLMVEELPVGTAGSPIARGLVRNSLQLDWMVPRSDGAAEPVVLSELRPMQIPAGAQADRLAVVGIVESVGPDPSDAPLALAALTRSSCEDHPPGE